MNRMSNRDRIARAAEEARLSEAEKATKKASKTPQKATAKRSKRVVPPVRMKIIWEVCNGAGAPVASFPYPDKAAAEAETQTLIRSTGRTHVLRPTKVPME